MTRKTENNRQDIYTRITNQIITALEQGIKPWTQPWNAAHAAGPVSRPLRHNGQPYSGINVLTLWASSMERHFAAPIWMTFKQARELGGNVRKGEKGSPVVYANTLTRTETDESTGEELDRTIPFMKGYTVFNIEQIEGLPAHYDAQHHGSITNLTARHGPKTREKHRRPFFLGEHEKRLIESDEYEDHAWLRLSLVVSEESLFEAIRQVELLCEWLEELLLEARYG